MLIDCVDFLRDLALLQKEGGLMLLSGQDDSFSCDDAFILYGDTYGGSCLVDGLDCVLDLLESTVRCESGGFRVISARHFKIYLNYM